MGVTAYFFVFVYKQIAENGLKMKDMPELKITKPSEQRFQLHVAPIPGAEGKEGTLYFNEVFFPMKQRAMNI